MTRKIAIVGEAWGEVTLTQGYTAKVDLADFDRVSQHSWCVVIRANGTVHAMRKEKGITVFMHHFILGYIPVFPRVIDHANRDGTDNRRFNLREASRRENALNSTRSDSAKLLEKHGNRWRVRRFVDGRRVSLGSFLTKDEALDVIEKIRNG